MTLPINTNQIKWNKDQFEIQDPLEHDDITLVLRGAITKISYEDQENGSYDRLHTFKPKYVEAVTSNGKAIKGIDKRKQSQLLRGQIEHLRREYKPTEDEQDYYDKAMAAVRHELINVLKTHNLI